MYGRGFYVDITFHLNYITLYHDLLVTLYIITCSYFLGGKIQCLISFPSETKLNSNCKEYYALTLEMTSNPDIKKRFHYMQISMMNNLLFRIYKLLQYVILFIKVEFSKFI